MAILRVWRADIRRALRDEYVAYVTATGLAAYRSIPGNLGASIAVRDVDTERSEIVTLSWWSGMEAVRAFAGPDCERARYFPDDDRFLLSRPEHVLHYDTTLSIPSAELGREPGAPA